MEIKDLRKLADLTQFQLAQRSGVSRMKLSLAECGQLELRSEEETAVRKVLLDHIASRANQLKGVLSTKGPALAV